jgi:two-component system response regulator BaeR
MIDPTTRPSILIVEDEPKLAALLADYLAKEDFTTTILADGREVVPWVREYAPSMVLLDRELRSFSAVPVMIITARVDEIDRLLGLELGADDYVCKPFSPREVVARVKAILRRAELLARAHQEAEGAVPTPFSIDVPHHAARLDGRDLHLTPIEFRLLALLHAGAGRIYARDYLLRALYEDHRVVADRTIDSHVKNLRRKIQAIRPDQDMIRSIYGVGYRLEMEPIEE